jgi:hypothetical protein
VAFTQAQRDALAAAIASGTKRVAFGDKTVEYQDAASMLSALQMIDGELAASGSGDSNGRCTLASTSRV